MARIKMEDLMNTLNAINATVQNLDARIAALEAQPKEPKETKKTKTSSPKEKAVPFTKHDGTVIYGTAAQVAAWEAHQANYATRKHDFEQMKATWAEKKAAYKPSKALKDAILENRAAITHKVAKEKYGFVGTKKDLQALKESICK